MRATKGLWQPVRKHLSTGCARLSVETWRRLKQLGSRDEAVASAVRHIGMAQTWAQLLGRASDQMVRRAKQNCPPYSRRRRWQTVNCGPGQTSIRIESNCTLRVFRRGKLWFAYRTVVSKRQVSGGLLCFVLGPLPICTHTREAIMRLAEYYHFFPGKDGMQWVDIETYSGHFLQPTS